MRRFSTLLFSAGVLCGPAFSQTQINLTGTWAAAYRMGGGPVVKMNIDLVQNGNRIDGHEQMVTGDHGIVLRVSGTLSGYQGYFREVGVEQNRNFKKVCLEAAQLTILTPDNINVFWQPSQCSIGNQSINLMRMRPQPSVSRNRQPQATAGDALLGMLLLGALMGGSDSGPSADQQERNNIYRDQVEAKERMDDQRQREEEHRRLDDQSHEW